MKRQLLTLIAVAITSVAFAQENDYSDIIGSKTEFITETTNNKSSLWVNAKSWVNSVSTENFKKVDSEDKESGTLLFKIESYLPSGITGKTEYSKIKVLMNAKIDCRDGKYRTTYTNFTAGVEPDRNADVSLLSYGQAERMTNELQRIVDFSENDFRKETIWSINDIVSVKDKYLSLSKVQQSIIDQVDKTTKKGQKTIKDHAGYIAVINEKIKYLDFILKGFGRKIEDVNSSLRRTMPIADNF